MQAGGHFRHAFQAQISGTSFRHTFQTFMRHQLSTSGLYQQDYHSPVRKKQNTGGTGIAGADTEEQEETIDDLTMKVVQEEAGGKYSTDPQPKPPDPNEGQL